MLQIDQMLSIYPYYNGSSIVIVITPHTFGYTGCTVVLLWAITHICSFKHLVLGLFRANIHITLDL